MNRNFTNYSFKWLKSKKLTVTAALLFSFNLAFSNIWAPWCAHRRPTVAGYGCDQRLSIEEVRIEQGSNLIYRKAPDGCAGPANINPISNSVEWGGVVNSQTNPIMLSAGATYRLGISSSSVTLNTSGFAAAWIDYNRNFSFVDAGIREILNTAQNSWSVNSPMGNPGAVSYIEFTIPCSVEEGLTRLRISLDNTSTHAVLDKGCIQVANQPSARPFYGETEDFYIMIQKNTSLAVDFIVPNNVFVNSPVTFVNVNRGGFIAHEWDRGLNGYDFLGTDFTTVFSNPGTQQLKLRSSNCAGVDSVIKTITIQTPTAAPGVDFVASNNSVEVGDDVTLFDLSSNGPTSWNWQLNNPVDPSTDMDNTDGVPLGFQGSFNRVLFNMTNVGVFNTCLTAQNAVGSNNSCKNSFINVTPISDILLGIGSTVTQLSRGNIFDRGGPNGNYSTGTLGAPENNSLLIQPCGAEEISLNVSQLRFADNAHNLRVWDGADASGVPLHPQGGFNRVNSSAPFTVVARSGFMYLELNTAAGTQTDSGIIANFEAILGQVTKPIPSFEFAVQGQTNAFRNAITTFRSNSSNLFGLPTYGWSVDGVPVPPANVTDGGRLVNIEFPNAGNFNVCLNVISCSGDSTICQTVNVTNPVGQTRLEFDATNVRPDIGEIVTFTTISDLASNFRWEIAPLNYELVSPSTLNSKELQVRFLESGPYRVQLRGWNSFDSAGTTRMIVKDSFIQVVNYCDITSNVLSADVGNNLLEVRNVNNDLLFSQPSSSGQQGYQDFASGGNEPIILQVGGIYHLTMRRNTNFDPVSRVVYADWNGDGVFTENEKIMDTRNTFALGVTESFQVPDIDQVIIGSVRMRAITSYGSFPVNPCQDVPAGEIEDYRIQLFPSAEFPTITLVGEPLVYVELGSMYDDAGATATDPLEGDVTHRIVSTSNINLNSVGVYTYRYNMVNANHLPAQEVTRTVIVTPDNTAPVITLNGNNPDYLEAGSGPWEEPGFTAFDNVDGDVTDLVVVTGQVNPMQLGMYQINYTVNDASGNTATKIRTVEVGDQTPPTINFVGDTMLELGQIWSDLTFASDNFWSGSNLVLTKTYGVNGPVNWNVRGNYVVHYHAVDGSGNEATATRTYRVDDFSAPTIMLNTPDTVIHDVNTPYNSVNPTIYDNVTATEDLSIFKSGTVNAFVLGTYTELFRAIDEVGNIAEATRTVKVVDRIPPTLAAPYICTPLYNVFNNKHGLIVEDNYYSPEELLPLVEISNSNVNIFFEGMYKALYQVTDPSGNTSDPVWRDIEVNRNCEVISSVNQVDASQMVSVYPNPSNGNFEINLSKALNQVQNIEIYNAVGTLVMTFNANELQDVVKVDMSGQAAGIYTVKISGPELNVNQKMIIVK